jgi:hypothetical protein
MPASQGMAKPRVSHGEWNCKLVNPFWTSFFTHLKSCGRSATLFMITLAALLILLVASAIIYTNNLQRYFMPALPGAAILVIIWMGVSIARARARRRERVGRAPLSIDELRKARSKLVKRQS